MDTIPALKQQETSSQEAIISTKDEAPDAMEFSSYSRPDSLSESKEKLESVVLIEDVAKFESCGSKLKSKPPYMELQKQDSVQSTGEDDLECRICQSKGEESLISPCKCSGSTKWVHESCLVLWFQVSRTSKCELCSQRITVKKYTKPIREWKRPNGSLGPCSKVDLWYLFVTLFSLGTIIGFGVFQVCVGSHDTETTVVFTAIYVLCAVMIVLRIRYFYQWFTRKSFFWQKWRRLNQKWFIASVGSVQQVHEESVV